MSFCSETWGRHIFDHAVSLVYHSWYGAHTFKGDTAVYGSGTIVAAIWTHGPIRVLISSHFAASLPQLGQVFFSGGYKWV
jgi:hypothetical protein